MTILERVWKATEVDREGFLGLFKGLGGFLACLGLLVLPFILIAIWVYVGRSLLQGLQGLFG